QVSHSRPVSRTAHSKAIGTAGNMIGQRADSMRIGLPPAQLRPEELLVQTADALERLETVANTVFARLEAKVAEQLSTCANLRRRAATCQATIDSLKGTTKAVQVFAAPKYPVAAGADAEFRSPFAGLDEAERGALAVARLVRSQREALNEAALMEMRHFMQVNLKPPARTAAAASRSAAAEEEEGLGRLPNGLTSLSSLLLFNTAENPYKRYTLIDPLGVLTRARRGPDDDDAASARRGPGEAPDSIRIGDRLDRPDGGSLLYMPSLGAVPDLDSLPSMLPRLPGVAENVAYSGDLGPGIAPSDSDNVILQLACLSEPPPPLPPSAGSATAASAPPPPPPPPP
ncbi:hypothetical protein BOX15_Mlig024418g5, partial [Macrostomum lignano]